MSATNRGAEREEEDTYVTHPWCAARFLEAYDILQGATVCDPCAAGGELLAAIKALRPDLKLYAFEIKPSEAPKLEALRDAGVIEGYLIANFLELVKDFKAAETQFDYVITNPPYALAKEMIEASLQVAKVAAHLLRINFLGSQDRYDFTKAMGPSLKILPNRPGFTGWGSDATEYAWFIYGDSTICNRWELCAMTDPEVIKAANEVARARYPHLKPELVRARKAAKKEAERLAKLSENKLPTPGVYARV